MHSFALLVSPVDCYYGNAADNPSPADSIRICYLSNFHAIALIVGVREAVEYFTQETAPPHKRVRRQFWLLGNTIHAFALRDGNILVLLPSRLVFLGARTFPLQDTRVLTSQKKAAPLICAAYAFCHN